MPGEWVDGFRSALDDEFGPRPRVVTLATVDGKQRPRARSVVCRRVDAEGSLFFVSDRRSRKNQQLAFNSLAEVVCWLPARKEQWRLRGHVHIIHAEAADQDAAIRSELWRDLSDATRATFYWPEPGKLRCEDPAAFPRELGAAADAPENFEVLWFVPSEAELLDLKPHPHDRRKWEPFGGWREQRLNP